jgi:misacylated tRNA(Ala) deacylase
VRSDQNLMNASHLYDGGAAGPREGASLRSMDRISRPDYQDHPDALAIETKVLDSRPGAVLVAGSPVFPGGGGQLADHARLSWATGMAQIIGTSATEYGVWHQLDTEDEPHGTVLVEIDPIFRHSMCELHTLAHVLNALVYIRFPARC